MLNLYIFCIYNIIKAPSGKEPVFIFKFSLFKFFLFLFQISFLEKNLKIRDFLSTQLSYIQTPNTKESAFYKCYSQYNEYY